MYIYVYMVFTTDGFFEGFEPTTTELRSEALTD